MEYLFNNIKKIIKESNIRAKNINIEHEKIVHIYNLPNTCFACLALLSSN